MYIPRLLTSVLRKLAGSPVGRGLIVTGARQAGKTTLLQREFVPEYEYHSFDEAFSRHELVKHPAADWLARGKNLIFDEVQKAPAFLGTVKAMLDSPDSPRIILSGSAQIQLLSGVRETLAGRVVTRELFPFGVAEMAGVERPFVLDLLACESTEGLQALLGKASFETASKEAAGTRRALSRLLDLGGMPAVWSLQEETQRWIWLEEYCQTYLQRDVADLGRVADLDDFFRFERVAARRTAGLVNMSDLARDADLSMVTVKKYLRYLDLSYQAFLLPALRRVKRGRVIKAARLHWVDMGVQRVLSGHRQGLTCQQFETTVVAEFHKLTRTLRLPVELFHLRTRDGREVDLLVRLPGGSYLAFEIKSSTRAAPQDARHLRDLGSLLSEPVIGGVVVYRGDSLERWGDGLCALPASALFAPSPIAPSNGVFDPPDR